MHVILTTQSVPDWYWYWPLVPAAIMAVWLLWSPRDTPPRR
jgi:hypothetical protein